MACVGSISSITPGVIQASLLGSYSLDLTDLASMPVTLATELQLYAAGSSRELSKPFTANRSVTKSAVSCRAARQVTKGSQFAAPHRRAILLAGLVAGELFRSTP